MMLAAAGSPLLPLRGPAVGRLICGQSSSTLDLRSRIAPQTTAHWMKAQVEKLNRQVAVEQRSWHARPLRNTPAGIMGLKIRLHYLS